MTGFKETRLIYHSSGILICIFIICIAFFNSKVTINMYLECPINLNVTLINGFRGSN